jgi:hypothetical protein
MGIAEQMGRTLQRTSISVNIKERLDFSCAIFDASGGLVANAPHLPVHLGAMQEAVRYQVRYSPSQLLSPPLSPKVVPLLVPAMSLGLNPKRLSDVMGQRVAMSHLASFLDVLSPASPPCVSCGTGVPT